MNDRREPSFSRPNELATRLNVSASTLRRWSRQFAEFLSSDAGDPTAVGGGDNGHRRYTADDEAMLQRVKMLLDEGFAAEQVAAHLADYRRAQARQRTLEASVSNLPADPDTMSVPPVVTMLAESLRTLADSQQTILGGQQSQRELMGVIVQDNFNLKDENARLREQMLELERDMGALIRRLADLENRLTVSEAVVALLQQQAEHARTVEVQVAVSESSTLTEKKSIWRRIIGG